MRKFLLLLLTSGLLSGLACGANASQLTDRAEAAIVSAGCPTLARVNPEQMILALSAWSGQSVRRLADGAGLSQVLSDVTDSYYAEKPSPDDVKRLAEGLYKASPTTADRIVAEAETQGSALCPVLAAAFADPLPVLVSNQGSFSSFYHSYLKAAQVLTDLHGCGPEELDGAFGETSAMAWRTLATRLQVPSPKGVVPSPGDVARAAAKPKSVGVCDSGQRAGTAIAPLYVLGLAGTERNWVSVDPVRAELLDALGKEGELTRYQQRLVAFTVEPASYRSVEDKAQLVEKIYAQGIGVAPNPEAARRWRALAREADRSLRFYELYLAALNDGSKAADAVEAYFEPEEDGDEGSDAREESDDAENGGEVAMARAGPLSVEYDAQISIGELGDLSRLATLVSRHSEAMSKILDDAEPALKIGLAVLLLDGMSVDGKNATAAAELLTSAASDGNAFARSRLAFMYLHGLGVEKDPARSRELALAAAEDDEPFAIYQLARIAERSGDAAGVQEAIGWYEKFLGDAERFQGNLAGTSQSTLLIANRLLAPAEALASPAGTQALARIAAASPDFARALGDVNLCTTCGGVIDLGEAVKWLRLAGDNGNQTARYTLSRLLKNWPELATSPDEAVALLGRNVEPADGSDDRLFGYNSDTASYFALQAGTGPANEKGEAFASRMAGVLDGLCAKQADDCENAAHLLASGRLDVRLVAAGIDRLKALNSPYLIDILAEYGDFEGALRLGESLDEHTLDMNYFIFDGTVNERSATIRRIMSGRSVEELPDVPEGLVPLLRFLAAHDDEEAAAVLDILVQKGAKPPPGPSLPTETLRANFDRVAAFGGLSRTLVNSARALSRGLGRDGQREEALRLELTALSAELQLDDISGLASGPLQVSLTRVCHLSKASERAFALGSDHVAMVLAKDAVNTLQKLRADLSNVPEELQACFRDLVADNYRWLADLFIRQGRLGEAEFVLGLLKDFEAFQFVERDGDFAGRSYEALPYSVSEQALKDVFDTLRPPTTLDARRAEELRAKRAASSLTPEERAELAAIEARLAEADAAYDAALDVILAKADELGRSDRANALADLGPLQGYLKTEVDEPTVALHYLVLPDRLSIVLTTADDRKSFTWTEWEGQPFSEARLDEEVQRFHDDLSNPAKDPRPRAKRLYDLLLAPFIRDIEAIDTKLVLVSFDRRLRYVPFATLFDGERYAVQRFGVAMLSDAGYEIAGHKITGAPIAALGTTQAVGGFAALPGVGIELDGIIKGADGFGLFDGKVELDKDFDKAALEDALRIGTDSPDGVGVVHISSHFALGATDAKSFLVLGTGDTLNLQEVKRNRRAFDFGRVDLLTLSACATGYADPALDGREMESLSQLTGSRGARAILATLWPVEDNSTAVLMQRFYELRERAGNSKAHALALTQREFIEGDVGSEQNLAGQSIVFETAVRGAVPIKPPAGEPQLGLAHPFYWAPFILTGNWR